MSQPPMEDDFQDHIQRILNDKKREDLRKQFGMSFEGHSEEMSPQMESEWLDYVTEFERQFENAKRITVRERIGNPDVRPLAKISGSDLPVELDRIFDLLSENNIAIDFLHDQEEREMYRFITEELLDEETDDIQIPGMVSHFVYEDFHPNDEDDIILSIDEFLYALFQEEYKDPESMHYAWISKENMHDGKGNLLGPGDFKGLVSNFYEAYPVITEHFYEVRNIIIDGDDSAAEVYIEWQGIAQNNQAIVRNEGISNFKLSRSVYGGWDITQVGIPGWVF